MYNIINSNKNNFRIGFGWFDPNKSLVKRCLKFARENQYDYVSVTDIIYNNSNPPTPTSNYVGLVEEVLQYTSRVHNGQTAVKKERWS